MQDKDMILDILSNTKANLSAYGVAITECKNIPVRETFQKMRDSDEQFQYDLYQLADKKGFYPTPENPTSKDIANTKAAMIESAAEQQGSGPAM